MSYVEIRESLKEILAEGDGLAGNVGYNDYQILNSGVNAAVVLEFTQMAAVRDAFQGIHTYDWTFSVHIFTPLNADVPTTRLAQDVNREVVMSQLRKYPHVNGVARVVDAVIVSISPDIEQRQAGDADFVSETLVYVVSEDVDADEQE